MTRRWSVLFLVVLLATLVPPTSVAADPVVDWTRQFGTSGDDLAYGIAVDEDGNIAVAGETDGTLPDQTSQGYVDAFVRTYHADGSVAWTHQFGTRDYDGSGGIAVDGDGRVVVAGSTGGTLPGQTKRGRDDAFVRVYRPDGSIAWTRQFGSRGDDYAAAVAIDAKGRIYVAGYTYGTLPRQADEGNSDIFVRVYRPDGRVAWARKFGTPAHDEAAGVAVDAKGHTVVVGHTDGTFPGQTSKGDVDAFVRVYHPDGSVAWTRQFGTKGFDAASAVAVDERGRVFVAGLTGGTLPGQTGKGRSDAFVRKYRADGRVAWTRQFGTSGHDGAGGIAVDGDGRVVVVGRTDGSLPGQTNAGWQDAYVRTFRLDGSVTWTEQFGTSDDDGAGGIAVDGDGRIALTGETGGTFPGQTSGDAQDAFVRVYVEP